MISSALVFIMIPSLSLIYSGLGNRSFALTLFRLPMITAAFVGLQWVLWGYLVTFSEGSISSNWWGGESRAGALRHVLAGPVSVGDGPNTSAVIPELLFSLYEGMFASFTAAVVCGGTMHRARPRRFIIFISLWALLVYDPVARWSWSSKGWLRELGSLDFAGGTPVHIVSGTTVAAFAVFCSIESRGSLWAFLAEAKRRVGHRLSHIWYAVWSVLRILFLLCTCGRVYVPDADPPAEHTPPHSGGSGQENFPYNINFVVLGTALLWFGWAGFNGGSALQGNLRAVSAWTATHVAACSGGSAGMLWIWVMKGVPDNEPHSDGTPDEAERHETMARQAFDRLSVWYFCDGAIAGLVAITPAAGYVPVWSAPVFGFVAALAVNLLKKETELFLRHDPLQIFAVHSGGGVVGMILTGIFAEYVHLPRIQIADTVAGLGYTFFMTLAILYFMKVVAYLFSGSSWRRTAVYSDKNRLEDEFQATVQQQWRGDLDLEGRAFPKALLPPPAPPERPPRPDDMYMEHLAPRGLPSPPHSASSIASRGLPMRI
ncbi:ammonium transporter AmtB-like domain-containing protein [Lasiosphaeria ovina]|uniref:Ammonium transporter AmtB-like domain-containing protein n=1 Tax=Lasiosphaeria ovina TaxID=92902 RepID=A0AAE0N1K2_9PEZI|nr:ammonium transporter AmtB-like domain-containing protein [Lasiosphaeria ovina]